MRICRTYSDLCSCYFIYDKLNSIKVILKVYVILDHPSYIPMFRNATIMIQGCSEDPEQTASSKQSDQCLHCLQFILYFNEASLFSMPIFE